MDTAVHRPPEGARSGRASKSPLASAACVTKTEDGPLPHLATPSTHPSQYSSDATPSTGRRHGSHRSPGLTNDWRDASPDDLISAASAVPRAPPRMRVLTPVATSPLDMMGGREGGRWVSFWILRGAFPVLGILGLWGRPMGARWGRWGGASPARDGLDAEAKARVHLATSIRRKVPRDTRLRAGQSRGFGRSPQLASHDRFATRLKFWRWSGTTSGRRATPAARDTPGRRVARRGRERRARRTDTRVVSGERCRGRTRGTSRKGAS